MTKRRRRYGQGSVRRDGTGWLVDIGSGGDRIRRWFAERSDADACIVQLRAERVLRAAGRHSQSRPDATYADLGAAWLDWLHAEVDRARTPRTVESYEGQLRWLLGWWGPRRLCDTSRATVMAYVAALRSEQLATSSIRHRLDRLAQLHAYAVEAGWIAAEPCPVQRPAPDGETREMASDELYASLLHAAGNEYERLALLLAGDAGLRRVELWALRVEDVDLGDDATGYGWLSVVGKGGKPREVPVLTVPLRDALRRWTGTGRILHWTKPSGMDNAMRALSVAAGHGSHVWLHSLRHRFTTRLREAGVPTVIVQAWVGHAASATTDRYTHARVEGPATAREALSRPETSVERQESAARVIGFRRRNPRQ